MVGCGVMKLDNWEMDVQSCEVNCGMICDRI